MDFGERRQLRTIERKLDWCIEALKRLSIAQKLELELEFYNMTTLAEVKAAAKSILVKAETQDDVTAGIVVVVDGIKALNMQLKADIEALIAAGGVTTADLEELAADLGAIDAALDADTVAKAVLVGTPAEPVPNGE